jgi:hypothetical protein
MLYLVEHLKKNHSWQVFSILGKNFWPGLAKITQLLERKSAGKF